MALTGNLYQDLTNLTKLYNESGKIILTGNTDVDYQILMYLEPESLNKICRTNKYSRKLCDNQSFWIDKFKHDKLPIIYNPDLLDKWLLLYKSTTLAKKNAEYALKIQNIENNKFDIEIQIDTDDALFLGSILSQFNKNIKLQKIKSVFINTLDGLTYNIIPYGLINNIPDFTVNRKDTETLLTYFYIYSYPIRLEFNILSNDIQLLATDDFLTDYPDYSHEIYKRNGMLNTLIYMDKNKF